MLILTAKLEKRKIALALTGLVVVFAAAAAAFLWSARPASATTSVSPKGIKTNEDRVAYLQDWGWLVSPEPTLVEELQMPEEFGAEYDQYLALQEGQGFDMAKYAGKRIKRYTYAVQNYPSGETGVVAHLLICKNRVIGGEVMGNGFLHGLAVPQG